MAILKTYDRQVQTSAQSGAGRAIDTGASQVWGAIGGVAQTAASVVGEFKQKADDANDAVIDTDLKNKSAIYSDTRTRLIQSYAKQKDQVTAKEKLAEQLSTLDSTFDSDYTSLADRYSSRKKKEIALKNYSYASGKYRDDATEILYSTERAKTTSVEKEVGMMETIALGNFDAAKTDARIAYENGFIDDTQLKRVLLKADSEEVISQETMVQATVVDLDSLGALNQASEQMKIDEYRAQFPKISPAKWISFEKQARQQKRYLEKQRDDSQNEEFLMTQAKASQGLLKYTDLDILEQNGKKWDSPADNAGLDAYQLKIVRGYLDGQTKASLPADVKADAQTFEKAVASKWGFGGQFESEKELSKYIKGIAEDKTLSSNQKYYASINAAKTYHLIARNPNNGEYLASTISEIVQLESRAAQYDNARNPSKSLNLFLNEIGENPTPEIIKSVYERRKAALSVTIEKGISSELLKRSGRIEVVDPDGNVFSIPMEQLSEAEKQGYKQR